MSNKWDLSFIYKDTETFLKDLEKFKGEEIPLASSFEGKLGDEKVFADYLVFSKKANIELYRLYVYAESSSDLNKKDAEAAKRLSQVGLVANAFGAALSYSSPEILALGEEKVMGFLKSHPEFSEYSLSFDQLFRSKAHVLGAKEEKLLSNYNPLLGEGSTLYSTLTVADYSPKKVKLSDGSEIEVNMSNWTSLIAKTKKAEDRAAIFECLYCYYDLHKTTYGEIYNTVLHSELSEMKSRGYASILEEHLYGNKIPTSVFLNLIEVASQNAEPLHRYYEIRRKYLGLEKHRSYDRFLQLAKSEKKYTYEEAKATFLDSIKGMPESFQKNAQEVLKEGYVDVFPAPGKRTGAYSNGTYNLHPLILLNFEGELNDVFTLAHESGHSIHTLYSEANQPEMKQDYTIFVAEIASTFNEHNLLDYFLNSGTLSKQDQIYLLQKSIDEICSTFYRQTLFAHYEYDIAQLAEKEQPINFQVLSDEMIKLYKTYFGIDIAEEKVKPLVWAYIPHLFYTPFYVYQYATSFTASMLLYQKVKNKEPGALDKYIGLLSSGSSDYPIEEVKKAGVDLTKKEAFLAVTKRMDELVTRLEKLLNE